MAKPSGAHNDTRPGVQEPTVDERGDETHPAFALIGASRVQSSPPGHPMFDSDMRHQHYVTVRLSEAKRRRNLNHDYIYAGQRILEVRMSEAQWASFVSSMNTGDGVPCTLESRGYEHVPELPYQPRLQESIREVHEAADKSLAKIREAFALVKDRPTKANIRNLEIVLQNSTPNMEFAATSLSKHTENVVQKARADLEAMVASKARQLGLEPGDLGASTPQLSAGTDDENTTP